MVVWLLRVHITPGKDTVSPTSTYIRRFKTAPKSSFRDSMTLVPELALTHTGPHANIQIHKIKNKINLKIKENRTKLSCEKMSLT